jgi:hypothetical protein
MDQQQKSGHKFNRPSQTVYASFGKSVAVSSQCSSFKAKEEQQYVQGVQPQVITLMGRWPSA